jgi:glycosyltransferase involved in cell wall biosynthesis
VVALRDGSVPEIVEDGVTGWVADDFEAFVEAIDRVDAIDPATCRRVVEERFSIESMVAGYERVYASVAA